MENNHLVLGVLFTTLLLLLLVAGLFISIYISGKKPPEAGDKDDADGT